MAFVFQPKPEKKKRAPPKKSGAGKYYERKYVRSKLRIKDAMAMIRSRGGPKPLDVMYDNMVFIHEQAFEELYSARQLAQSLRVGLRKQVEALVEGIPGGLDNIDIVANLVREIDEREEAFLNSFNIHLALREFSQKCAADMAQYVHPKLSAVALRTLDPEAVVTGIDVTVVDAEDGRPAALPPPSPQQEVVVVAAEAQAETE